LDEERVSLGIYQTEESVRVEVFGKSETFADTDGNLKFGWTDTQDIIAVPYDIYITGYNSDIVSVLRLWQPKAISEFDFNEFEKGNYEKAVHEKNIAETLCKVLYPMMHFIRAESYD